MHLGDFDFSRPLTPIWLGFMFISTLVVLGVYVYHERQYRIRVTAGVIPAPAAR